MTKRWVAIATVLSVAMTGCGSSAQKVSSVDAKPTASAAPTDHEPEKNAPMATAAPANETIAPDKLEARMQQAERAEDERKKQEILRQLEAEKEQQQKLRNVAPNVESPPPPPPNKPACKCVAGDPLCSCIPDETTKSGKKKASVHAASTSSMSGRISPEQVESAVADHIDIFATCTNDDVTVSLKALITDKGKVTDVSARRSTPDLAKLRDCVVTAFKTIQFPASSDGKSVPIEFDLVLSPSS
jgi:hypothetical protein